MPVACHGKLSMSAGDGSRVRAAHLFLRVEKSDEGQFSLTMLFGIQMRSGYPRLMLLKSQLTFTGLFNIK